MSMSTHVVGFRPRDKKWNEMLAAWTACRIAGVDPPKQVLQFFDNVSNPDEQPGLEVSITAAVTGCQPYEGAEGFDVDLDRLPPDVKIVRFYLSW